MHLSARFPNSPMQVFLPRLGDAQPLIPTKPAALEQPGHALLGVQFIASPCCLHVDAMRSVVPAVGWRVSVLGPQAMTMMMAVTTVNTNE